MPPGPGGRCPSPPRCPSPAPATATASSGTTSPVTAPARCAASTCPRSLRTAAKSPSPPSTRSGWAALRAGARRAVLVRAESARFPLGPSWAPDGASLVYSVDRDGLYAVRRHDLRTGAETVLARGGRVFPALSPDGGRLASLDLGGHLVVTDRAAMRSGSSPLRWAVAACPAGRAGHRTAGSSPSATATGSTSASARATT